MKTAYKKKRQKQVQDDYSSQKSHEAHANKKWYKNYPRTKGTFSDQACEIGEHEKRVYSHVYKLSSDRGVLAKKEEGHPHNRNRRKNSLLLPKCFSRNYALAST